MTYNVICVYVHAHAYLCMCMWVRGEETNKLIKTWSISDSERYYGGKYNSVEAGKFREPWECYNRNWVPRQVAKLMLEQGTQ